MTVAQNKCEQQQKMLDPDSLMEEAQKVAGLSDYGDMTFVKPMVRLLDRAAHEVSFSEDGLNAFKADCIRMLVNQLRFHQDLQDHPEILDEDVSNPIIIIGLPRSGTTKLQRVLASAPETQKLFIWRMLNPAPFPSENLGERDPRKFATAMGDIMAGENQEVGVAHEMAIDVVDEEMMLFDFSWDHSVNGFNSYIPVFFDQDWVAGGDREADRQSYRYVRKLLQYLQWQDGGKRNRPWIMKAIIHIAHMDALTECFPNATLVHCHRTPHNAVPSFAKMMWAVWNAKANGLNKKSVGQGFMEWAALSMERYMEARNRLQLNDKIIDVKYDDIRTDVLPIIKEIYSHAGLKLTTEAEQAMQQWQEDNEQGKHGQHVYSLDEFGLDEQIIDQKFAHYIEHFIPQNPPEN